MSRDKILSMNNLVLLTGSFPYEGGEQFLESEIQYWKNTGFDNVYIIPHQIKGSCRSYPKNIKIIEPMHKKSKAAYAFKTILSPLYYKEVLYAKKNSRSEDLLTNIKSALKATALTLRFKETLEYSLKSLSGDITVYSYWNDVAFYAACELKKSGVIKYVISRAHGFDIYTERRTNGYMPLKRQFAGNFDKVFLLSENALKYYSDTYGADSQYLTVGRLGVSIPLKQPNVKSVKNKVKILSLSYCVPVKQIDKIMVAIAAYAKLNSNLIVEWTHIGDGPLYHELKNESRKLSAMQSNLKISFLGNLPNSQVISYLAENYFDVFINTSKSEGVPVSIMEAMSYGIPAIAPDVGEISDLVNESNGYLLSRNFNTDEIIDGLNILISENKNKAYRINAKSWVEKHFNSSVNYPLFVSEVEKIAGISRK